ncbi:hypothetical protein BC834DRAFT_167001 [Gloeopeniophorella convolvens]|nr:hypothetical protein BC834DRAFT_167001 [Gloeopeniophorella convolvens]
MNIINRTCGLPVLVHSSLSRHSPPFLSTVGSPASTCYCPESKRQTCDPSSIPSEMITFLARFCSGWQDLRPTTASILVDSTNITLDAHVGPPSSPDHRSIQVVAIGLPEGNMPADVWNFGDLCSQLTSALSTVQRLSIREDVLGVGFLDPFAAYPDEDHNWGALLSTFSGITWLDVGADTFPTAKTGAALRRLGAKPGLVPHLHVIGYRLGDPDDLDAVCTHKIPSVLRRFVLMRAALGRPVEVEYVPWQRGEGDQEEPTRRDVESSEVSSCNISQLMESSPSHEVLFADLSASTTRVLCVGDDIFWMRYPVIDAGPNVLILAVSR